MKIALSLRTIERQGKIYDAIENVWNEYLKGHELILVPNRLDQDFDKLADSVNLFILTGGDNRKIRRMTERRMVISMMKCNKPIIGICHGAFLLTKFLGGQVGRKPGHTDTEHTVTYNNQKRTVNSSHKSYILTLPNSAKILASDSDGHCEAWIDHNIAGVVWHPERMNPSWIPSEIANFFSNPSS